MTSDELAELHPRLFHVTAPDAWPGIKRHGLLSTEAALDLHGLSGSVRAEITGRCRPEQIEIQSPGNGHIVINDNKPMSEVALSKCLDDGLQPADWLSILNRRVFFWSSREGLDRLLKARLNVNRKRLVIEVHTRAIVSAHCEAVEICPINSGSTIRKPARRGLSTFTPLAALPYRDWQKLRGRRDKILEVTFLRSVPDIGSYVVKKWIT